MSDRRLREAERRYAETSGLDDAIRLDQEARRGGIPSPVVHIGIQRLVDMLDRRVRTVVIPFPGAGVGYQKPEDSPSACLVKMLRNGTGPDVILNSGRARDAREAYLHIHPSGLVVCLGPRSLVREEAIERDGLMLAPRSWEHREEVTGSWLPFSPTPVVTYARVVMRRWTATALISTPPLSQGISQGHLTPLPQGSTEPPLHPHMRRGPTGWWYTWRWVPDDEWEVLQRVRHSVD